jgi:TonB family protein
MRGISWVLMLSVVSCGLSTARRADWDSLAAKAADPAEAPKRKEEKTPVCRFDAPDSVLDGRRSGLVGIEYDVGASGEALNVEPLPGFPGPGAPLFDEVAAGLKLCRFPLADRGGHTDQVIGFKPPTVTPVLAPQIVEGAALLADKGTLPSAESCDPGRSPAGSDALRSYVVASNGVASEPIFVYEPIKRAEEKPASPEVIASLQEEKEREEKIARAWLSNCRFTPARNRAGEAVSVRVQLPPPPSFIGDALSKPVPAHCATPFPSTPEAARRAGVTGLVLVKFVVDAHGHTSIPELLNPKAPRMLYRAVREWILSCTYEPSRNKDGTAVPVRMVQPFSFSAG